MEWELIGAESELALRFVVCDLTLENCCWSFSECSQSQNKLVPAPTAERCLVLQLNCPSLAVVPRSLL